MIEDSKQSALLFIQVAQVQRGGFTLGLIGYLHYNITV